MTTADIYKLIGLDVASVGIVITPISWTVQDVEDQILFALKVFVALTAIGLNIHMYLKNRNKKRQ